MRIPILENPIIAILSGAFRGFIGAMFGVVGVWFVGTIVGSLLGGGSGVDCLFSGGWYLFITGFVLGGIFFGWGIPLYAWTLTSFYVLALGDSGRAKLVVLIIEFVLAVVVAWRLERCVF